MKFLFILAALVATGPVMAQERSAGGTRETQMTWSALSNQISAVQAQVGNTNGRIDDIVTCAKKGMVYALGAAGVDSQNCLATAGSVPPGVLASLNTNTTNIQNVATNITAIANCSQSGGVIALSGSSLVCNPAPAVVEPSFKIEVGSFSQASSPGSTFCTSRGYDVTTDVTGVSETYHCGGSSGGDCTRTASYNIKCARVVKR